MNTYHIRSNLVLTSWIFAILIVSYSTTFIPTFGVLDDYVALLETYQGLPYTKVSGLTAMNTIGVANFALAQGRILNSIFIHYQYGLLNSVEQEKFMRFIGVVGTACYVSLVMKLLLRWQFDRVYAFAAACLVGLLPPFVEVALFAGMSSYSWSCAIAMALMIYMDRVITDQPCLSWRSINPQSWDLWFVAFGITVSLFSYPPAAQLFFCLPLRYVFSDDQQSFTKGVRCVLTIMVAFIAGGFLFVVIWKTYAALFFSGVDLGPRSFLSSPWQVLPKARWFLGEVLLNATNLFKFVPSRLIEAIVFLTCLAGILTSAPFAIGYKKITLWLVLIPCTYAANLLVYEDWASYRTQFSIQTFFLISLTCSVLGIKKKIGSMLHIKCGANLAFNGLSLLTLFLLATRQFVEVGPAVTLPHVEEWQIVRTAAGRISSNPELKNVIVVRPHWSANGSALLRYDTIGTPSSFAPWITEAMLRVAVWDIDRTSLRLPVEIVTPEQAATLKPDPGNIVIDLDSLIRHRAAMRARPLP
jgi:hypothetical protein